MKDTVQQLQKAVDEFMMTDPRHVNWTHKPGPDKWSKKEIIGHLVDSAQVNLQRFVRCTYQENFKLTYDQVEWVQVQRYQEADLQNLVALWELLNLQIIRVLQNYPPSRLKAQCNNSKTTTALHTVEWLAQDYVDHLNHHLEQVYQN